MGYAFNENKNIYKTQTSEIEVQMAQIITRFAHTHFGHCTCTTVSFCDYCNFLQLLENCSGIINYDNLLNKPHFLQSTPVDKNAPEEGSNTTQAQNVGFDDDEDDAIVEIPHTMTHYKVDTSQNVLLGDFLRRPTQVYSHSWIIGNTMDIATHYFQPWHAFFNYAAIRKKLDNYYLLRCNLHLKFVVNASPFFYGCSMASYQPLTNFNPSPIVIGAAAEELVPLSQRPHIYVYPQDSQGGEMILPFLYHKNWLDVTSATDLQNMGKVSFQSFGPLLNANGVVGQSIEIVVYAWAEDVELAGPTVALAVQSKPKRKQSNKPKMKDEYADSGVVSKPASAIAHAAGLLSEIPVIGPFATATQYAANAVSDIASLFGFTNTPVIDDIQQTQLTPFPNLASTDIGMPVDKLTLDAKNELSIDPSIGGVASEDELLISHLVQRESFILQNTWSASDSKGTLLFHTRISPKYMKRPAITGGRVLYYTPMAYLSEMFKFWRGDIVFRFKFICSKYHRGRVRINWDPHGDIGAAGDYTTETYTRIVDITENTDVEFVVPYTQSLAYLSVPGDGEYITITDGGTANVGVTFNGCLTMRVLNTQTSPIASADIRILCFVRGSSNIEFACPIELTGNDAPYAIQSKPFDKNGDSHNLGCGPSVADPNINLVYMGERVTSLRQLMRRQSLYKRCVAGSASAIDNIYKTTHILSRNPLFPGFDVNGVDLAIGPISTLSEPYNWVNWHPTSWMSLCFVGHRGSYIYTVNVNGQMNAKTLKVVRTSKTHTVAASSTTAAYGGTGALKAEVVNTNSSGIEGQTITSQETQAGITALLPMYSNFKFQMNSALYRSLGIADDGSNTDSILIEHWYQTQTNSFNDVYTDLYIGAGPDYSLIFFLNCPCLYSLSSYPTPLP
jgi:hypothetical protein